MSHGAGAPAPPSTFEALHRARIRGLVPLDVMGDVDELVQAALLQVTKRGVMLTPEGLVRHEELLGAWRATLDIDALANAYEGFLRVNQRVKDLCADWQRSPRGVDELIRVVDRLSGVVDQVLPCLRRAGQTASRFASYGPRLQAALDAAADGDGRFINDPRLDSLHTIWFECHEDFLVSLGRSREEEGSF
jgi:hypothetical protein